MTILEKATAIRSEAWAALMASPDFATFKASDEFVVALGGASAMPEGLADAPAAPAPHHIVPAMPANGTASNLQQIGMNAARRLEIHNGVKLNITQADAAAKALREAGKPLSVGDFMVAAIKKGARMKGDRPLANFRSAVSKDDRFTSIMSGGRYFWWFAGEDVPSDWNETAGRDLLTGPAASSVHSNQEETGHAPATT